jgi:hypothetical protein
MARRTSTGGAGVGEPMYSGTTNAGGMKRSGIYDCGSCVLHVCTCTACSRRENRTDSFPLSLSCSPVLVCLQSLAVSVCVCVLSCVCVACC